MSALVSIGGAPVLDVRLTMPRVGAWVLEAGLMSDAPPAGKVSVRFGEQGAQLELKGTVAVGEAAFGATVARVRAGAGRLGALAAPKHWRSTTVGTVLTDLLEQAGESLSPACAQEVLQLFLAVWTINERPVGQAVTELLAAVATDVAWRTLADGTLWVGRELWPVAAPEHELLSYDPLNDRVLYASLDKLVLPGQTFRGRRVSNVEHSLRGEQLRSQAWFEGA